MLTDDQIDDLVDRVCKVAGVRYKDENGNWIEPEHRVMDAWEDHGDIRLLLDPPCVDGGTMAETVSLSTVWFPRRSTHAN